MGELVVLTRHLGNFCLDRVNQLLTGLARLRPLRRRFEHHVTVRNVGRHRIRRDLGSTCSGEHTLDLREFGLQRGFQLLLHRDRLRQTGTRNAQRLDRKIPLVQAGDKLTPESSCKQPGQNNSHRGKGQHQGFGVHHAVQQGLVDFAGPGHDPVFFLGHLVADEQCNGCGNEGDRKNHGADQGNHDSEGHRVEHLSFDACQCEDRQIHDHDDQLTEQQRTSCLLGRQEDLIESLFPCQLTPRDFLSMGESAYTVLDDHDGAVNDDAEVQGPQTHQVGTDLLLDHPRKGEEHRQRDHHGSQNGRPHVPEEQEQDGDHQNGAFKKVLLDGVDGLVDQDGPVINRHRMHTFGQIAVDLDHLLVNGL